MVRTRPLSPRGHELLKMPTIASQLPYYFRDPQEGKRVPKILHVAIVCGQCKNDIPEHMQRGMLTRFSESEARYEAMGLCADCMVITPVYYFIDSEFRFRTLINGRWHYSKLKRNKPEGFIGRLWQSLRKLVY